MLERFGGYTLQTLLDEDAELLQLVQIEEMARPPQDEAGGEQEWQTP